MAVGAFIPVAKKVEALRRGSLSRFTLKYGENTRMQSPSSNHNLTFRTAWSIESRLNRPLDCETTKAQGAISLSRLTHPPRFTALGGIRPLTDKASHG